MAERDEGRGTRKRAAVRKEEIVAIASEVFATMGYNTASLRDIAERAGLTKAALYYHFPDKTQIFEMVVLTRLDALNADVGAAVAAAGNDPLARLLAFFDAAADRIDADPVGWIATSNSLWTLEGMRDREAIRTALDAFEDLLRAVLRDARASGLVAGEDAPLLARLMLSSMDVIPRWMNRDGPLNTRQIMRRYLRFILGGALTETGRARLAEVQKGDVA